MTYPSRGGQKTSTTKHILSQQFGDDTIWNNGDSESTTSMMSNANLLRR